MALDNCDHVLSQRLVNIIWIYSSDQPLYDELQRKMKITFVKSIPDSLTEVHLIILDSENC